MASLRKLKKAYYRALAAWHKDFRLAMRITKRITYASNVHLSKVEAAYRAERIRRGLSDDNPCIVDFRKKK